jgi:hypothetical protein
MQESVRPLSCATEVAHVCAGAERVAFPSRHDHPHGVIGAGLLQRGQVLAEQCPRQAVALIWAVEPADEHSAVPFDQGLAHRDLLRIS